MYRLPLGQCGTFYAEGLCQILMLRLSDDEAQLDLASLGSGLPW